MFPELAKDKSNIVKLTYREHYICHWLLMKIYPCAEMIRAFWLFNSWNKNKGYTNSYAYAKSRSDYISLIKGTHLSDETKKKLSDAKKGRTLPPFTDVHRQRLREASLNMSDETKKKISNKLKGRKFTDEHRRKLSIAANNMSDETRRKMSEAGKKKVFTEEWKKKISNSAKGRIFWNNGIINKFVKEYPGEGWIKGFLKK